MEEKGNKEDLDKIFENNLIEIKRLYEGQNQDTKRVILDHLDQIIGKEGVGKFNPEIARRIRLKRSLTQKQLAFEVLDLGVAGLSLISRYETGVQNPKNPLHHKNTKKYFLWLREQGYNPFGL